MNLLSAPWLPFKLRDGQIEYRPPTAIADAEVIDLAMPRADFQGAAYQWLIGLLQTALAPEDHDDWLELLGQPPDGKQLEAAFSSLAPAFEFDGDGPRFMQDFDLLDSVKPSTISGLLIDAPGGNTAKENRDLFVKRGRVETLCIDCAAIALFTLQINAPEGGRGHLAGMRGGGPLTTFILPEQANATLWRKLWLNVVPSNVVPNGKNELSAVANDATLFPWTEATPESDTKGSEVRPNTMHPLHVYWTMPRRYRLIFEDKSCLCDLCGRSAETSISQLRTKIYGINYGGPWLHPFTPYRIDPGKPPLSAKGQLGGVGYEHWSQLALPHDNASSNLPATVVHDFLNGKYQTVLQERQFGTTDEKLLRQARLWAFAYDMKQMNTRGWYSVEMPLVAIPSEQQDVLRAWTVQFVELSRQAAKETRKKIAVAWFKRPKDAKGDMSDIDQQFYEATQPAFFRALRRMGDVLMADEALMHVPVEIARDWYQALCNASLQLFDDRALSGPLDEMDMKRVIRARQYLSSWWRMNNKRKGAAVAFAKWANLNSDTVAADNRKETIHE